MNKKLLTKEIQKRNKAYEKATPAQRRVMIAKDAIGQIKAKKYEVGHCYLRVYEDMGSFRFRPSDDAREVLSRDDAPVCRVCAKGALFLSGIRIKNCYTMDETKHARIQPAADAPGFSASQWHRIEIAYEDSPKWFKRYEDDTARLIAILKNIIKNNGTFKP